MGYVGGLNVLSDPRFVMISIQQVEASLFSERRHQSIRPGDKVRVHVVIDEPEAAAKGTEKTKSRIQVFEGTVIALHHGANRSTITVRKISYGVGVERIFPLNSPNVPKIEVKSSARVRRARLFYLRGLRGKAARLKQVIQ
jgi:large subunit ribosomal protein L19